MHKKQIAKALMTATIYSLVLAKAAHAQRASLKYGVEYKCGERLTVYYCRSDDQSRDAYPVQPQDDYCSVEYPDRPSNPGFVYTASELRGDLIKKLQACGVLSSTQPKNTAPANAPAGAGASTAKSAKDYFLEAQKLYQEKKYSETIEVLKKALAVDPTYGYAIFYLAMCYSSQQQYPQAIPLYKQLLAAKWDDVPGGLKRSVVMQLLAIDYLQTGHYADAEAVYRQAVARDPKDPHAQFGLGKSLALQGEKPEASQVYRVLATLDQALAEKLNLLIEKGDSGASQAAPAGTVASSPVNSATAYLAAGNKYYQAKDYPNALQSFQKALTAAPDAKSRANSHSSIAGVYLAQKQYEKALPSYQDAVRLNPQSDDAYVGLGVCNYYLRKYPEAVTAFQHVVQLKPGDSVSYDWLATSYIMQGKKPEAVNAWTKAIALKPKDAEFLLRVGDSLSSQKVFDTAITAYRGAVELKPDAANMALAQYGLGHASSESKEYPQAIAALREAVRLKPDYVEAHFELGRAYNFASRPALAIPAFQNVIRLKPNYGMAYLYLGEAYEQNKQLDLAMAAWKHILVMSAKEKNVLASLGSDFESIKQYDLAAQAYRSSLAAGPSEDGSSLDAAFDMLIQDSDSYAGLARIYYEQKKYAEIVRLGESAPKESYIFAHELGTAYVALNQLAKAAKTFEEAVELDEEKKADSLYDLGHCYNLMGRKPDARRVHAKLRAIEEQLATKLLAEINQAQ